MQNFLNHLPEGGRGRVVSLLTQGSMRRRLQDIGLVTGTEVSCELLSPAGDPAAYRIRGALIALRSVDAAQIVVEQSL